MIYVEGKPMCVDTPEVQAWLHSVGGLARVVGHHHVIRDTWGAQGLPMSPGPEPGVLYWPQGGSRWAVGYFLAGTDQLPATFGRQVVVTLASDNQPDTANGTQISFYGIVLAPIPLTGFDAIDGITDRLWLVPVVDYRWKLAKDMGEDAGATEADGPYRDAIWATENPVTWAKLVEPFASMGNDPYQMDWSIPAANEEAALKPSREAIIQARKLPWRNFNLIPTNGGEILDMVAANVGAVVVHEPSDGPEVTVQGQYHFLTWDDSYTRLVEDLQRHRSRRMAGGDCYHPSGVGAGDSTDEQFVQGMIAPRDIRWVFGTVDYGHGRQVADYDSSTEVAARTDTYFTIGATEENVRVVVTDTAGKLRDTFSASDDHGSVEELQTLAQMLTNAIMARWRTRADYTFAGICHFRGNAYVDMVEYRVSTDRCYTRLHPIDPWAFRREYQHATTEQPFPLGEFFSGSIAGAVSGGYYPVDGIHSDITRNVPAYMIHAGTLDEDLKVGCTWNETQKRYEIISADCE